MAEADAAAADKLREAARRRREKLLQAQARRMRIASGQEATASRGPAPDGARAADPAAGAAAAATGRAPRPSEPEGAPAGRAGSPGRGGTDVVEPPARPKRGGSRAVLAPRWTAAAAAAAEAALRAMHASARLRVATVACAAALTALAPPQWWRAYGADGPPATRVVVAAEAAGALAHLLLPARARAGGRPAGGGPAGAPLLSPLLLLRTAWLGFGVAVSVAKDCALYVCIVIALARR